MGICFLEKKCHRISEISFLPSLKAKLLFTLCIRTPSSLWMPLFLNGVLVKIATGTTKHLAETASFYVLCLLSPLKSLICAQWIFLCTRMEFETLLSAFSIF